MTLTPAEYNYLFDFKKASGIDLLKLTIKYLWFMEVILMEGLTAFRVVILEEVEQTGVGNV
jgi:hypothetical protein